MRTSILDIVKDLKRELSLRIYVYPKRIAAKKLTQAQAEKQQAATQDTIDFVQRAGKIIAELSTPGADVDALRASAVAFVADFGKPAPERPEVPEETQGNLFG